MSPESIKSIAIAIAWFGFWLGLGMAIIGIVINSYSLSMYCKLISQRKMMNEEKHIALSRQLTNTIVTHVLVSIGFIILHFTDERTLDCTATGLILFNCIICLHYQWTCRRIIKRYQK